MKKIFEEEDVVLVLKKMLEIYEGMLDDILLDLVCNLVNLFVNVVRKFVIWERF